MKFYCTFILLYYTLRILVVRGCALCPRELTSAINQSIISDRYDRVTEFDGSDDAIDIISYMLIILYHYSSSRILGKRVRLRARECIIYANTTGFNRFLGRARHEDIINNNNRFLLIHRVSECRRHCHS